MMEDLEERILKAIRNVPDFPQKGIQYKDISTLFLQPGLVKEIVEKGKQILSPYMPEAIAGIESRGFLFGLPLAMAMDIPFVMIRKAGKLPAATFSAEYKLEYGTATVEMHKDALEQGKSVAIVDDVLATGGTAMAAFDLIRQAEAAPVAALFLAELSFLEGRRLIEAHSGIEVLSMVKY